MKNDPFIDLPITNGDFPQLPEGFFPTYPFTSSYLSYLGPTYTR